MRRPSRRGPEEALLGLQGRIGNQAVARLIREGGPVELQRACACGGGCSGCKDEQMRGELQSEEGVQRACECGGTCDHCREDAGPERPAEVQRQPSRKDPTLRFGSRSPAVVDLQQLLIGRGVQINADGIFGPATGRAVKDFQRANGLEADGVVGPKTWSALRGGAGAPALPPGGHELVLTKLRTAIELLRGLKEGRLKPQPQQAQPSAAETAGAGLLDDVWDTLEGAAETVGEAASEVWSTAAEGVETAADWVEEKASTGASWVEEKVKAAGDVASEVVEAGGEVVEEVTKTISDVGSELAGIGDDLRKRFGKEIEALEKAVSDLGRGFGPDLDWDAIGSWLDKFVNGVTAAANVNEPGGNELPADCKVSIEAEPMSDIESCPKPIPGSELDEASKEPIDELDRLIGGHMGAICGGLVTFKYTRVNTTGNCPISFAGLNLEEEVTSDGACSGRTKVTTGVCPIDTDGSLGSCRDTYGICLPREMLFKGAMSGTCRETFTQVLKVAGFPVETHQIRWTFEKMGASCRLTSVRRS